MSADRGTTAWRCFVAVPLDDELRVALANAVAGWRARPEAGALRWAEPSAWHLTLAFLGSVPVSHVDDIAAAVRRAVERRRAFSVPTGGVGAFPSPRAARVAWYGVVDDGRLGDLAGALRAGLQVEGASFRAHVTLARSSARAGVDLREWLALADPPRGRLEVDRVELMRSHLGHGPARYETLATVTLGAVARV